MYKDSYFNRTEDIFRLSFQNAQIAMGHLSFEGVFLYANNKFCELLGYSLEYLLKTNIENITYIDDVKYVKIISDRVNNSDFTIRFINNNNDIIFIKLIIDVLKDESGSPICYSFVANDVTEQSIYEKQPSDNNKSFIALFQSMLEGVAIHELIYNEKGEAIDYEIVDANPSYEKHTGIKRELIVGKKSTEIYNTDSPPYFDIYKNVALTKIPERFETYFEPLDKHFQVSVFSLENGQFATVFENITEKTKMLENLKNVDILIKTTVEGAPIVLFKVNTHGEIELIMGSGLEVLGYDKAELKGLSIFELFADNQNFCNSARRALNGENVNYILEFKGEYWNINSKTLFSDAGDVTGVIGVALNITSLKLAENSLYSEKERLHITLKSIGDAVIATDKNGIITVINKVAEQLTGWRAVDAIGKNLNEVFDIFNEITGEKCENPVVKVLKTGKIIDLANHTALISKNGDIHSIADSAAPIVDKYKNIVGVVLVFRDVSNEKKKEREIVYLSYHDGLTGLYNRFFFENKVKHLEKEKILPISIIMGDVNGLKLINDVFGHIEGDKLLIAIAKILEGTCGESGVVSRYGGDEFCILLPNVDANVVQKNIRLISNRCAEYNDNLLNNGAPLSISLGYATKFDHEYNIANLIKSAEDSMYKHKLLESRSHHNSIISSIRATLFEKSYETELHAERMIEYSRAIGRALHFSSDELNDLSLFAMLHDIGKIGISDTILTKPDKLSDEEWIQMKRHPEIGYRIVQASPDLSHISDYVLTHHERYDGKGYPQGLKENEIPLLSRILSIVDAYDVMTQGRVYKGAMSKEDALIEIVKNSGTQFDPELVKVFLENI